MNRCRRCHAQLTTEPFKGGVFGFESVELIDFYECKFCGEFTPVGGI